MTLLDRPYLVVGVRVLLDLLLYLLLPYLDGLRLGLRLRLRLVEGRPRIRLVGLRLVTRLVGLRLVTRLVGLRLVTRLIGLRLAARLVVGVRLPSWSVLSVLGLAPRLVLVGLRAIIRLGGLRLTRRIGVRLLNLLVPPGECLRCKTRGDRGLTEDLVRGEYDLERWVRWVRVGERRVYTREGDLVRAGEYGLWSLWAGPGE